MALTADAARSRPRVLVIGSRGQVGTALATRLPTVAEVTALDRRALDLLDVAAVRNAFARFAPQVVVNAAGYTAVDRAESESELAFRVNGEAVGTLADEARRHDALLVHYSTDYVFDGALRRPYREDDATGPLSAYGRSKLAGETALLASGAEAFVFRCSWVYSRSGANFLTTMERLAAGPELRVVSDQSGAPTWSGAIAEATSTAIVRWWQARAQGGASPPSGIYHLASPDHTTWHGFAEAIVAALPSRADGSRATVRAISTAEYPTAARRPAWSVLDPTRARARFGITLPGWRDQLAACLAGSSR
jgi:dTDP-4-dehydrorhamnose reductase